MNQATKMHLSATVQENHRGLRADLVVSQLFPQFSRAKIKKWMLDGYCMHLGNIVSPRQVLPVESEVELIAHIEEVIDNQPLDMPLEILHQDEHILVVNKPAGLIMHPGAGNPEGTLLNALLHFDPSLAQLPRAGIVHRLDKDTSGIVVIARSQLAYQNLIEQFAARTVEKNYYALVHGVILAGGFIDKAIGRDPVYRTKMAVKGNGKPALTNYRVVERFNKFTLLDVNIATGRTHQIRVHFADAKKPLAGDIVYGGCRVSPIKRQALHAYKISFSHPETEEMFSISLDMPIDMIAAIDYLREKEIANN